MNIIWFKRDLRIEDHEAFVQADKDGSVVLLYILEPELWQQSDMSHWHYLFLQDCLPELSQALKKTWSKVDYQGG